jgi:hypothetical protein
VLVLEEVGGGFLGKAVGVFGLVHGFSLHRMRYPVSVAPVDRAAHGKSRCCGEITFASEDLKLIDFATLC